MERYNTILIIASLILLFSLVMISVNNLTGYATESSAISNVTISKYLSIDLSGNLSDGINFGSVNTLPAADINASDNYAYNSTMFINVSTDSNTAVDFCIKANTHLTDTSSGSIIGLGNETYQNSSATNVTHPGPSSAAALLTTAYAKASLPTGQGNVTYYRLWLDVPSGIPSGNYNNSVSFKGVETTTSC